MGYVNKTISYLKRNGVKETTKAVLERVDRVGMDEMQKFANAYTGRTTAVSKEVLKQEAICFSLIVPAYETNEVFLRQLIDSVLGQTYRNLQLVIADASTSQQVKVVVESYQDKRIIYHKLSENAGISENTNEGVAQATGDYIGLLDHDDVLELDALYHMAKAISENDYDMVYSDEDKMSADGLKYFEPNIKPNFNFDYLLSNNYICHFTVIRSSIMKNLMFRKEYDGAQDYDLFLRTVLWIEDQRLKKSKSGVEKRSFSPNYMKTRIGHIPEILYHWRAHEASTADNPESKRYAYEAGKACLADFLRVIGWKAKVEDANHLGFYEINYEPDLFSVRTDVTQVGCYISSLGRVTKGPVLDGKECFAKMNTMYSGYLHRKSFPMDVDSLPKQTIICAPTGMMAEQKKNSEMDGKRLYLPKYQYEMLKIQMKNK